MDMLDHNVPVDITFWVFDAQSQHPASKKTDFPAKHEFIAWEYTHHDDGSNMPGARSTDGVELLSSGAVRIRQKAMLSKGLSTTRFHQGFQRRNQSQIRQDESRHQREASKHHQSWVHLQRRRQRLGSLDKRNGFNIITGQFNPKCRCTTPFHTQPRTRETGSLSEVAERAEHLLLRDSQYKFHAPAWSGKNHDERQDLLVREGLNKPKKSTLLGIGGADLASVGAEDMFSKAIYEPSRACAVEGLIEKCIPGRYTPRKAVAARKNAAAAAVTAAVVSTARRNDNPSQRSGPEISRDTGGLRPASSPAAANIVFRVVPNGLGNHATLAGRGGATVAGIAPPKRLQGSRSTPVLRGGECKFGESTRTPSTEPCFSDSPSPGGSIGGRAVTGIEVEGGPGSGIFSDEMLHAKNRGAVEISNGGDNTHASGSRRSSRGLSRSKSDFAQHRGEGNNKRREKASTAGGRGFGERAASKNRSQRFSEESGKGNTCSPSSTWRGATPAERRKHDQLALDLATVRSL